MIRRSYTGFQAFVAIGLDLVFGLAFEVICLSAALAIGAVAWSVRLVVRLLGLYWRVLVAAMTALVWAVTLPFVMLHRGAERLRSRAPGTSTGSDAPHPPFAKPDWAWSREV
ncbi:MAG: hypothetical protein ACYC61_07420 [Isosphaeraceae bacterium]